MRRRRLLRRVRLRLRLTTRTTATITTCTITHRIIKRIRIATIIRITLVNTARTHPKCYCDYYAALSLLLRLRRLLLRLLLVRRLLRVLRRLLPFLRFLRLYPFLLLRRLRHLRLRRRLFLLLPRLLFLCLLLLLFRFLILSIRLRLPPIVDNRIPFPRQRLRPLLVRIRFLLRVGRIVRVASVLVVILLMVGLVAVVRIVFVCSVNHIINVTMGIVTRMVFVLVRTLVSRNTCRSRCNTNIRGCADDTISHAGHPCPTRRGHATTCMCTAQPRPHNTYSKSALRGNTRVGNTRKRAVRR